MATEFKSYVYNNVSSTLTTIFTAPEKCVIIGLIATNIYGSVMPISLKLTKSAGGSTFIVKNRRIDSGQFVDFMQGNKLILETNDYISANAGDTNAFDVTISVLKGAS
jgi:hypothetical protein